MGQVPGEAQRGPGGMPPGIHNLFASLLDPGNARQGDAVYSQEALDRIISTLMEQHPTSNAPGPASPDAIASLPKKKLGEKQLGPEGKGECSVCMDDVHNGDEVVELPCTHWFHEACAAAWLGEHNTCPICRKGIEAETSSTPTNGTPPQAESSSPHSHRSRAERSSARNEARLNTIRNLAGADPLYSSSRRTPPSPRDDLDDYTRQMPGAFGRRNSEMNESQRDSRRPSHSNHRSQDSRRSSQSNSGTSGAMSWLRDRFIGNSRRHD
jgi:E3 ubiquitin-protein ligase RNF115/126